MIDTSELRKLLEKATLRPWRVVKLNGDSWQVEGPPRVSWRQAELAFDDGSTFGHFAKTCEEPNRDLIVAAVNALPAMLAELDALRADLREAMELLAQVDDGQVPHDTWLDARNALLEKHKEEEEK